MNFESDTERDILKIVYINRYTNASSPQVAYIHGVGIRYGAFATSITHDSHNIIAVGCTDMEIRQAVNAIVETGGGLSVVNKGKINVMPLPIGGIMSDRGGEEVAACWQEFTQECVIEVKTAERIKKVGISGDIDKLLKFVDENKLKYNTALFIAVNMDNKELKEQIEKIADKLTGRNANKIYFMATKSVRNDDCKLKYFTINELNMIDD